jgi:GAF domain-containing protein/HAMP domain-containing protein
MNLSPADQTIQYVAWLLTLVEFVLAVYVLLLNARNTANQHTSALLLLLALDSFIIGGMVGPIEENPAIPPLDAALSPLTNPMLLLTAVILLRPQWVSGRRRWVRSLAYLLILIPIALTLVDMNFNTRLWYTGVPPTHTGGYFELSRITRGPLSAPIRVLSFQVLGLVLFAFLLYVLLRRGEEKATRRLALLLLIPQAIALIMQIALRRQIPGGIGILISSAIYALSYAYATFQQMISERRLQRGRLPSRLTLLIAAVIVPLVVAVVIFVNFRAEALFRQEASNRLQATHQTTVIRVSTWLDLHIRALRNLTLLPEITSMDPEQQRPALQAMVNAYPYMYLVSTTDLTGVNVARSDDQAPKDYHDRAWFFYARSGSPIAYQTVLGRTSGQSALVVARPIRDPETGLVAGVGMFAITLADVSEQMQVSRIGETGYTYVVDADDLLVAHPDPEAVSELTDLSDYPPVAALRRGVRGVFSFTDSEGRRWQAYLSRLGNNWGVITQQQESEILAGIQTFQNLSWVILAITTGILIAMTWLAIRQSLRPIGTLTATAQAITAGDLTRVAPVESEDELGVLARTLNRMTEELRGLIGSLEERVAARTADLARRSAQLEAAATVARDATAIRDVSTLLAETARLISDRFGFYHAGIFLLDEAGEYAVLRAASSEGGQRMLRRGHKLRVGEVGIVGYVAATGKPRIALDVGADAVFFSNPDLPLTRSEMTLPLKVRERTIGALDVQSTEPAAFTEEDIAVLQILADQLALAIENARLLEQSQNALRELQAIYAGYTLTAQESLERLPALGYDRVGIAPIEGEPHPAVTAAVSSNQIVTMSEPGDGRATIAVPLRLRDQVIGAIAVEQPPEGGELSPEDLEVIQAVSEQVGLALESARLYAEARERAEEQEGLARIAALAGSTLEIGELLDQMMHETRLLVEAQTCVVLLEDREQQALVAQHVSSDEDFPVQPTGWRVPMDAEGFEQSIFARGGAYYSNMGLEDPNIIPAYRPYMQQIHVRNICGVALRVRERSIGELYVVNRQGGFGREELRILRAVAGYMANAIENTRLFAETQAAARRTQALYETSRTLSSTMEEETLIQAILQAIYRMLSCEHVLLSTVDERNHTIGIRHGIWHGQYDLFPDWIEQAQYPLDAPDILTDIYRTGQTEIIAGWDERFNREIWEKFGHERLLRVFMPIKARGRVIGIVEVGYDRAAKEQVTQEELQLMAALIDQAAVALDNARLFEEARLRAEELAVLNETARAMASTLNAAEVAEVAFRGTSRLVNAANFYVALYDPETETATFPLAVEEGQRVSWQSRRMGKGLTEYVARTGKPLLIEGDLPERLREMGVEMIGRQALSWLGVPLMIGDQVLGVMAVQSYTFPSLYDAHDRDLLTAIASQTASALQNARLFERMQGSLAETETLYNASRRLTAARDLKEIVAAVVEEVPTPAINRAMLWSLERDADGQPEAFVSVANWYKGEGTAPLPVGVRFPLAQFPATQLTVSSEPFFSDDIQKDPRVDSVTQAVFRQQNARALAILPIWFGARQIGLLMLVAEEAFHFTDREMRPFRALVGQMAVAIENRRLFEEAERRATRERTLREITARVRGATDPEVIMRTMARELGTALGRPTFIRLGSAEMLSSPPTGPDGGNGETLPPGGK